MKQRNEILLTSGFLVIALGFVAVLWWGRTAYPDLEEFTYDDGMIRAESDVFAGDVGAVTAPTEGASTKTLESLRRNLFSAFGEQSDTTVKPIAVQTSEEISVTIAHASPSDVPEGFTFETYVSELRKIEEEKKAAEKEKQRKNEDEEVSGGDAVLASEDDTQKEIVRVDIGVGLKKPYYPREDENDMANQQARSALVKNVQRNNSFGQIMRSQKKSISLITITAEDAHQQRMLEELQALQLWAGDHEIIISEIGITNDDDNYIRLADKFFEAVNPMGFHTTAWAVGDWWGGYGGSLSENSQISGDGVSGPFVRNPSTDRYVRGLNLAGGEFGMDPDANGDVGQLNQNYTYHIGSGLWRGMKDRGFTLARFPFRLERLFNDDGSFDDANKRALEQAIDNARQAKMKILLDPHNYGAIQIDGSMQVLGGRVFTESLYHTMLVNLARLAEDHDDVIDMIGLMNEPKHIESREWERITQRAVNALRKARYNGIIEVPTANWQGIQDVPRLHPDGPWIKDPQKNFYYGVHQYFDENHSGHYLRPYGEDESRLRERYTPGGVTVRGVQ